MDFNWCNLITKIPDLSMVPNITELKLNDCKNLVEIDDSVGHLDKLEVWDLWNCNKLETLLNCLTMKSLTFFNLIGSKRIKKFPDILHKIKGVVYLDLEGNYTNELPPSFGYLIGLKDLIIYSINSRCAHLLGSIYNLHVERLKLHGEIIFPKNVEIDRQPMCTSLGCSSKYVFPMLKQLQLIGFYIRSEIEFILNYCCGLTLEELEIHKSKVVTLLESMRKCERLHTLIIRDCDEFREIPRLPHSIRRVEVAYCHSLDLQSFFQVYLSLKDIKILFVLPSQILHDLLREFANCMQLLPEIIGLPPNLPPCLGVTSHMLMFPHSSTISGSLTCRCEYSFDVTGDENHRHLLLMMDFDCPLVFHHKKGEYI